MEENGQDLVKRDSSLKSLGASLTVQTASEYKQQFGPYKKRCGIPIYVWYCLFSAMSYTVVNCIINEISELAGPFIQFYFTGGAIITGLVYNIIMSCKQKRDTGRFYVNQNFKVDGQMKWQNVIGFSCLVVLLLLLQNLVYMTIFFAGKANINIGVITILWCIDPVYLAIADYFLNG
jgi:drug/metabolite transporter (DMT)-like permease